MYCCRASTVADVMSACGTMQECSCITFKGAGGSRAVAAPTAAIYESSWHSTLNNTLVAYAAGFVMFQAFYNIT
jgi:hypothetical protein